MKIRHNMLEKAQNSNLHINLLCASLITIGILLPDFYLGYIAKILTCTIPIMTFLGVLGFSVLLSFIKNRYLLVLVVGLLILTQTVQINHWAYFGAPIQSHDISKVFFELDEIFQTGSALTFQLWRVWLVEAASIGTVIFGVWITKNRNRNKFAWIPLIIVLSITPVLSHLKGPAAFYTKPTSSTIYNTTRAFSDWVVNSSRKVKSPDYKPYSISYRTPKVRNVVLIMGESLSSRYMHLYGYSQPNTPYLDSLKNDPNFAFSKGVSSSVSTITSLQLFFNTFRNPGHTSLIRKKEANLFRLAKHQGYKTFVISAQNEKLFHDTGIEFVDHFGSEKDIHENLANKGDEALIDSLQILTLSDKNFIVIHLRHIHTPFDTYTKHHPELGYSKEVHKDRASQAQQEYSNAILYHDYWVKQCIAMIQKLLPQDTVIFFTSDHGQLLGERSLYGHNLMEPEVSDVPVWSYCINTQPTHLASLKNQIISHYDLAKHIGGLMGATITNPNENSTHQFVHSSEIYTNYQFMPWKKEHGKVVFFDKEWVCKLTAK